MFAWIVMGVVALTLGCRMCADTYDYCGPVVGDGCCPDAPCHSTCRAGSILSGERHPVALRSIPDNLADPVYANAKAAPSKPELDYTFAKDPGLPNNAGFADDPGVSNKSSVVHDPAFASDPEIAGGRIISITDRKVDDTEAGPTHAAEGEIPDSDDGWTARRSSAPSP
jgi:hypothetical protein